MINKYTLSFLVPMYKEGREIIKPLLDSIAIQQNVDFDEIEVVITHDGIIPDDVDYKLSDDFINSYPFNITYLEMEHGGVSAARNYCLDHCSGEYVCFCDCDDMFFNNCGLWLVFKELSDSQTELLSSKFVEEIRTADTREPFYINRDNDSTFVHGKFIKRQFLINNNIRWNEALTIHEDSYFNCLCKQLSVMNGTYKYSQTAFYLWKWRKASVCRHDPLYLNKTYTNMLDSNTALVNAFLDRGIVPAAAQIATSMIYETYYAFNTDRWWNEEGHEYLLPTEKRFKEYWGKFKDLSINMPADKKVKLVSDIRNKYFVRDGLISEKITFDDWIKHIEELEE